MNDMIKAIANADSTAQQTSHFYVDKHELSVHIYTLVIRGESIRKVTGSISAFCNRFRLHAETNGRLILISTMSWPCDYIHDVILEILQPLGLKNIIDYTIVVEQATVGVGFEPSELIGQRIPGCEEVSWLGSAVRADGCFIWAW